MIRPRRRGDRGSTSLELVMLMPAMLILIALLLTGARYAIASQAIETAAFAGARAASLDRGSGQAANDARTATLVQLERQHLHCASLTAHPDLRGFAAPLGAPASVGMTVSCTLDLADITAPGLPGTLPAITKTATSPLDSYRIRSNARGTR